MVKSTSATHLSPNIPRCEGSTHFDPNCFQAWHHQHRQPRANMWEPWKTVLSTPCAMYRPSYQLEVPRHAPIWQPGPRYRYSTQQRGQLGVPHAVYPTTHPSPGILGAFQLNIPVAASSQVGFSASVALQGQPPNVGLFHVPAYRDFMSSVPAFSPAQQATQPSPAASIISRPSPSPLQQVVTNCSQNAGLFQMATHPSFMSSAPGTSPAVQSTQPGPISSTVSRPNPSPLQQVVSSRPPGTGQTYQAAIKDDATRGACPDATPQPTSSTIPDPGKVSHDHRYSSKDVVPLAAKKRIKKLQGRVRRMKYMAKKFAGMKKAIKTMKMQVAQSRHR